jgi:2-hydroxychromene-2-carboxylate isomerase
MTHELEFWFSIGSTYTYLTVMRMPKVLDDSKLRVIWRPFNVREIMQDMNNVPFVGKPAKLNYMWRDLERRARRYGIPIKLPVAYPLENFELANRVAVVGEREGWCQDYVSATYSTWFQGGAPAGDDQNLAQSLQKIGQSYDRVIELAKSDNALELLKTATKEATSKGIFGSPSFIAESKELFWGDDRLEDAVGYLQQSNESCGNASFPANDAVQM